MSVVQQVKQAAVTSVTYPGTPASVPEVRRLVRAFFAVSPRINDLELISAELATNAIRHTPSGAPNGTFTVTIQREPGRARLEVRDLGTGAWSSDLNDGDEMADHGRGLGVVAALADEAGRDEVGHGQVVWAVVTW